MLTSLSGRKEACLPPSTKIRLILASCRRQVALLDLALQMVSSHHAAQHLCTCIHLTFS